MARPAFERDAYLTELSTEVIQAGTEGGTPWAVTSDTVFYPSGGGQPADRGSMGGAEVVDVRRVQGAIRHDLSASVAVGPVQQVLDWGRRYDHMQQHTAQHLLTAIALGRFDWPTTAFHLGPVVSDVELDVASLARADLERLEDAVNASVREARLVSTRYADRSRISELGVRSRLLPQDLEADELRLVEIEGLDLNTCGGTHVASTAEIGAVVLIGTEPMRGGTRVFFVAGDRVRRRLAAHEERNARLRELLDSADDDLPAIVELRIDRERQLARERRRLLEELVEATVLGLVADPEPVVARHWGDDDMELLQRLGRRLVEAAPAKVALLTCGEGRAGFFVVAAGAESCIDLSGVGPEVAALLGGRGGGAGGVFQGKASRLAERHAALSLLRGRRAG